MIEYRELGFVVWGQPSAQTTRGWHALLQRVIEKMIREHRFEMDRFVFQIRDKGLPTHTNLCFGNMAVGATQPLGLPQHTGLAAVW
jgi:hypothetical protein